MSVNTPPNPNVDTFNNLYWISADSSLTQAAADLRYLKFPVAQGTENLQATNIQGTLTCNSNTIMNNTLTMSGATSADRTINNCYYNLLDINSPFATTGFIYSGASTFYYDNNINSGSHTFATNDAGGVQTIPLTLSSTNMTIATTNPPTCSATQPASSDSSTKIPTTAWVQSAITAVAAGSTQTISYTASGTTTTPTNCRFVDIQVIGYGGVCGVAAVGPPVYYGGSGSGGNLANISSAPMEGGRTLTFTFVSTSGTGYVLVQYTNASGALVDIAKVYNGNKGDDGNIGTGAAGATINTTPSVLNSNFGTWFSATGTAGLPSTLSGGGISQAPALTGTGNACPRGTFAWGNAKKGCGQRDSGGSAGGGLVTITYHIA